MDDEKLCDKLIKGSFKALLSFFISFYFAIHFFSAAISLLNYFHYFYDGSLALKNLSLGFLFLQMLLSTFLLFLILILRQLPKKVLLILILFTPFIVILSQPFCVGFNQRYWLKVIIDVIQIIVSLYCWIFFYREKYDITQSYIIDIKTLYYFFKGCLLTLIIGTLWFFVFLGVCVMAVSVETKGFVTIGLRGIYSIQKTYAKQDKSIYLLGMIHIGNKVFYDSLVEELSDRRTLVLKEGVSDKYGLIKKPIQYEKIADTLGLDKQNIPWKMSKKKDFEVRIADLDISDFSQSSVYILNLLSQVYDMNGIHKNTMTELNELFVQKRYVDSFFEDIVIKRNKYVLSELYDSLASYDYFIIPWGALHLPGIENDLKKKGFYQSSQKYRLIIEFEKVCRKILDKFK